MRANESQEASIGDTQQPKTDAVVAEDNKETTQSTVSLRDLKAGQLLDGEETPAEESRVIGLPWGSVEIFNVSIVRRSME